MTRTIKVLASVDFDSVDLRWHWKQNKSKFENECIELESALENARWSLHLSPPCHRSCCLSLPLPWRGSRSLAALLLAPIPDLVTLVATTQPANKLSPAATLIPTTISRANLSNIASRRIPDDKVNLIHLPFSLLLRRNTKITFQPNIKLAGITCGTTRHLYEGQAKAGCINPGYEYSYWTINPNHINRVNCSCDLDIFLINRVSSSHIYINGMGRKSPIKIHRLPTPITIAFARVADLARVIRIKCDDKPINVNGEGTDYGSSEIVVSQIELLGYHVRVYGWRTS